ncbi:HD domain-containing protein [Streptomyces sp. NPDC020681]|uniref:HD domain-containing protein n=1 Tax=Streptomyces sp. NPDC020681 TaxID=3365083 RepID=UPI00378D5237
MTTADPLQRALHDTGDLPLRPLPQRAAELLEALDAPPRLAAHLRAVHDVAHQLVGWAERRYPTLRIDRDAVLFGAATHDLGKTVHVAELGGSGSRHEEAGRELLLSHGVSAQLARFAATHASWSVLDPDDPAAIEDLLVSVADKVWKNKRVPELEDLLVARLAAVSGREVWEEFLALDEVLARIGEDADARLDFQAAHPVRR